MRKVHLLLIGLLALSSTLVAAVPQGHSSVAPISVAAAPAAVSTAAAAPSATDTAALAAVLSGQTADQACILLCVIGKHCCIINNHSTCIPDTEPCPIQ
ncbi:MAG TPA: hypothetical protein VIH93_04850 [Thermoanaerobaculia bacterium]|jgi:hypothetical protein